MKIKQSELPGIIGVTRQAISRDKVDGKIEFDKNNIFNSLLRKNKEWLAKKNIDPKTLKQIDVRQEVKELKQRLKKSGQGPKKKQKKEPAQKKIVSVSENVGRGTDFSVMTRLPENMMEMTLKELAIKHGTQQQLKAYVDILDKLMSAARKDVDIQERRKELLPRSLMEYMFQYLEVFNNQVFDFGKSITDEIISISQADAKKARAKIPEMLICALGKLAKESKKNIIRELKKYENNFERKEGEG